MSTPRTYLVTGATGGMGRAIARRLADRGARLLLTARDPERLRALAAELGPDRVDVVAADLAHHAGVEHVAAHAPARIDGLVLNAGIAPFTSVEDTDEATWDATFALNVKSRFFLVRALLARIVDGGAIVMTTSSIADRPLPEASAFAASLDASRALARCLAVDLRHRGLRVATVSAGPIDTPIYEGYGMPEEALAGLKASLGAKTLAGRMGRADEIADAIMFLLENRFATGLDLTLDGGYRLA